MNKVGRFFVSYDHDSDVLYVNLRREVAAKGIEDVGGIVWRYAEDGSILGMTLLDFRDFWRSHKPSLADKMSRQFGISFEQATNVIDSVEPDSR